MPPFATIPATERNSAAQHQDPSPMSQPFDLPALASSLADKSPQDILKAAFEHFGDELWISFSGAEDVVLVDMAWKLNRNVKVFSLDTGRLHPETYRFIDQVREHYGIAIDVLSEAHAGILFHAPENVIREFPQFPAVHTYEDLKREFLKASSRSLSL